MSEIISRAIAAGSERVMSWADVLDRINVFPVPDGDTGRNLVISLGPLRRTEKSPEELARELLLSARGNSGNIAARFFSELVACPGLHALPLFCERGRDRAYGAVPDPKPGTMLTLFDVLVEALRKRPPRPEEAWAREVVESLEAAVRATTEQLPELREAGVVDAGALGMFIFFDSCLAALIGREGMFTSVADNFKGTLSLSESWEKPVDNGFCLDVVLRVERETAAAMAGVYALGESVVAMADGDLLKVHLHAEDREEAQRRLAALGSIVSFEADDLRAQTRAFSGTGLNRAIHIMTDAAGSITREDARSLGLTLLDSYVNIGTRSLPETYLEPEKLFEAMRRGEKVSTSQASEWERRQCYRKALDLNRSVLYIAVGSVYTGNFRVASDWKEENDAEDRLVILDSGSASGRLGLAVLETARLAQRSDDPDEVIAFARKTVDACREYIFLDKLQWLAAGGRLSKTSAFFGDVLHMKPVISPQPDGARKMGVVRSRKDQVEFMLKKLKEELDPKVDAVIMLEYSDNQEWLEETVRPEVERRYARAEILRRPMSLTSGAHMGPGTWGVAFLPRA
ncbi:MAG: DegV family protein [Pseudomonadota bacterium]